MKIAVNLDLMMVKRKISVKDLAEQIGMTNVNLSNLKTGKMRGIRFDTLAALCKVLKCQPGDILEFVDDENE